MICSNCELRPAQLKVSVTELETSELLDSVDLCAECFLTSARPRGDLHIGRANAERMLKKETGLSSDGTQTK